MTEIKIDLERDKLFDELGLKRLRESYMLDSENSPQERFAFVSKQFGSNPEHAQRLYDYASKHWLSYSTPVLSFGRSKSGLPISCFLSFLPDSASGLVDTLSETNWLSMLGGGIGVHVGIRSSGDKSTGVMPHMKTYDASSLAYRQGRCYIEGTEVLTTEGWKRVETLSLNDIVATVLDDGRIVFEHPNEIVNEKYNGKMIKFFNKSRGIDFTVTEDHSMVLERKTTKGWSGLLEKVRASDVKKHNQVRFWLSAKKAKVTDELSPQEMFAIAFQADGSNNKFNSGCTFHVSKQRKIERLRDILNRCGFSYVEKKTHVSTKFYVHAPVCGTKDLSWIDLAKITPEKANAFLEEIGEWDSYRNREHSFVYSCVDSKNVDIVQSLAVIAGRSSRKTTKKRNGNRKDIHCLFVGNKPFFNLEKLDMQFIDFSGDVYCCVVSSGKIIVRNGSVPLVCGNTRRGSYATYLDISHPDIIQFLEMRKPTGDQNMRCLNLHHGINITDDFMQIIERCMVDPKADDNWELKDPHNDEVKETVSAKELWQRILEMRMQTGEPYIVFIDTANKALPEWLKAEDQKINGSNLCCEIFLPTSEDRTAVCCLSSLNLEYYDEWKDDPQFIRDVAEMLDNVLTHFIENAPDEIKRARYSAYRERSIGVGALGLHAYFQKNNIPFESALAKSANMRIFRHIKEKLDRANVELADERGACPDAGKHGFNVRFSHTTAIAPNASTSLIMGNTSPSIEPYRANVFRQDTLSGAHVYKNRFLQKVLEEKCAENNLDVEEVWSSIISRDGSVQHLDWLDDYTKAVFKTATELDQRWIIDLAGDRQQFIDQGQSVNLFFPPDVGIKYLHAVHFLAWKSGLKGLYYCRSDKLRKADRVSQRVERKRIEEEIDLQEMIDGNTCLACE